MALAKIFIETEAGLYKKAENSQWKGTRPFKVTSIVNEGKSSKSLRLAPVDGKEIGTFVPGQYITGNWKHSCR